MFAMQVTIYQWARGSYVRVAKMREWLNNGWVLPLIALLAGLGFALAVERLWMWLRWQRMDAPLRRIKERQNLLDWLNHNPPNQRRQPSPLHQMLHATWQAGPHPQNQQITAENAFCTALAQVETRVSTIGWLASILPLLGLLGTVIGLAQSFQVLSHHTSREALAQGLGYALSTTQAGLVGALPLLAFHHLFERLGQHWQAQAQRLTKIIFMTNPL